MTRWRRAYGASPLHLLVYLASFALTAAAVVRMLDLGSDALNVLAWFVVVLVAHDLVLVPLYTAADRAMTRVVSRGARPGTPRPTGSVPLGAHVRVPAALSLLMLAVFAPLILRLGPTTFHDASTLTPQVFLSRWLALTGALFGLSAAVYAVRVAYARRRGGVSPG